MNPYSWYDLWMIHSAYLDLDKRWVVCEFSEFLQVNTTFCPIEIALIHE